MKALQSFETSVTVWQPTGRNILEDLNYFSYSFTSSGVTNPTPKLLDLKPGYEKKLYTKLIGLLTCICDSTFFMYFQSHTDSIGTMWAPKHVRCIWATFYFGRSLFVFPFWSNMSYELMVQWLLFFFMRSMCRITTAVYEGYSVVQGIRFFVMGIECYSSSYKSASHWHMFNENNCACDKYSMAEHGRQACPRLWESEPMFRIFISPRRKCPRPSPTFVNLMFYWPCISI